MLLANILWNNNNIKVFAFVSLKKISLKNKNMPQIADNTMENSDDTCVKMW